jgi:hypothetical protein
VEHLIDRYLGSRRRAGRGFAPISPGRFEDTMARTRFGSPRVVFAPGRPDIVPDIDGVVSGYSSMSWAAPHLFGSRRIDFDTELRTVLRRHSPDGRFWDWPGDTEIVIAAKPPAAR